ncbi:MAG: hypothetical protein A2X86_03170 [Bdellovibrionales bacterium GWA2_49_15]|nr:MAG: hypothetical protein A2X86_03170 [Bdellovibrionales bacterium GWA2_49_15]HAZ12215.1 hypothetical protein [Bdellovibrionales bacterium]
MDNIVDFRSWIKEAKEKGLSSKENSLWNRFYKALDFHALISEANDLIHGLREKELSRDDWARARAMLQEIELRLANDGRPEAQEIRTMAGDLENRLRKLAFL